MFFSLSDASNSQLLAVGKNSISLNALKYSLLLHLSATHDKKSMQKLVQLPASLIVKHVNLSIVSHALPFYSSQITHTQNQHDPIYA